MKQLVEFLDYAADRMGAGLGQWNPVVQTAFAVIVAAVLRLALTPVFETAYPFITFYPAIIFATILFGWKHGLGSTVACALLSSTLFNDPIVNPQHAVALVVFLTVNSVTILVGTAASRARRRAEGEANLARVREQGLREEIAARNAAEEALRRSAGRLDLLAETGDVLLRSEKPQTVIDTLSRKVMSLLDCHTFFNYLFDPEAGRLHLNAWAGIPDSEARRIEWLDLGAAVYGAVALDGTRIVAEPIGELEDLRTDLVRSYGIQAYACYPFLVGGKVIGTLSFGTRGRSSFSEEDLSLMKAVADQISIAIQRKRAEEELARAKQKTEAILESAGEAIFWLSANGLCSFINPAGAKMFGYRVEELVGKNTHKVLHHSYPDGREYPAHDCPIYAAFADGQMHRADDEVFWHKDRRPIAVAYTSTPVWEGERLVGAVVVVRDITERKKAEDQLKQLTAELEQRVTERTSKLVQLHERLRDLTVQLNLTEQRERRRLATDLHDYLAQLLVVVRMKLRQMTPLVSNSKATGLLKEADQAIAESLGYAQSLVAELAPLVLHEFGLLAALDWLASQMQRHGLLIKVERDIETLSLPEDQAVLIYQSVRELLFNVLKHAQATHATVSVAVVQQDDLEVTVADDGNGFDPVSLTIPGLGANRFGLFSIRERMESMGGRFEIHSAVGQGTSATLVIPYRPVDAQARSFDPPQLLSSNHPSLISESDGTPSAPALHLRVLLVDDHAMVRQGLRSLLEAHADMQVVGEAADGVDAIESTELLCPDVVVMDVTMPRIDGIDATRRIRQNHPSIVVVGLSVNRANQVEAAMKAAGAAAFISKESAGDELCEAIRAAVGAIKSQG